jgi:hypothetical protein
MTRLSMVFTEDLKRDTSGLLASLKDKYAERLAVAEQKRDSVFRTLFLIDAALAFLVSGQNFKVPVVDVSAAEIPVVVEAATLASAIALVLAVVQFVTWASYDMISRQYANHAAGVKHDSQRQPGTHQIDPDFISAAETHNELAMKLFRSKFNIFGADYYEPGRAFRMYSAVVHGLIFLLFILFPIVHGLLVFWSLHATYSVHGLGIVITTYILIVIVLNLLGVFIWVGSYKDFQFSLDFDREPWIEK